MSCEYTGKVIYKVYKNKLTSWQFVNYINNTFKIFIWLNNFLAICSLSLKVWELRHCEVHGCLCHSVSSMGGAEACFWFQAAKETRFFFPQKQNKD